MLCQVKVDEKLEKSEIKAEIKRVPDAGVKMFNRKQRGAEIPFWSYSPPQAETEKEKRISRYLIPAG